MDKPPTYLDSVTLRHGPAIDTSAWRKFGYHPVHVRCFVQPLGVPPFYRISKGLYDPKRKVVTHLPRVDRLGRVTWHEIPAHAEHTWKKATSKQLALAVIHPAVEAIQPV